MEGDGPPVPVEAAAVAAQVCGRDVAMWVRRQPVLAVCSPRAATIGLHPDALLLAYRQLLAIVAQQAAHLASPWPMQLRTRLRLAAPGAVITLGLLAVAVGWAVTGRHADAAYTGYTAAVVGMLAAWLPLARHLRRRELDCDQLAAATAGADTLAAAIATAARWQTDHDTSIDRALGRAAATLKLSAHPTPTTRITALTAPNHDGAAERRS